MKKILFAAALLYFFLSPLTYHPDNKLVLSFAAQENGGIWNIWEYGQKHFRPDEQFSYPPVHWLMAKTSYPVAKLLASHDFNTWLKSANNYDPLNSNINRYMFSIKFTLILFCLLSGYLIYRIVLKHTKNSQRSLLASALWLFNPIVIYSVAMMGQNDVFAITFFLLGWLFLTSHPFLPILFFGAAISTKIYPLIWLVFLLIPEKLLNLRKKAVLIIGSLFVYLLTILPFINNQVFQNKVLNSAINDRFLYAQINIGFDEVLYLIPILLIPLFIAAIRLNNQPKAQTQKTCFLLITANLILLGFTHFHPQWFTWIIPFWAIWLALQTNMKSIKTKMSLSVFVFLLWFTVLILFRDKSLSVGMFSTLNPNLVNLPLITDFLKARIPMTTRINSYAHTMLAGIAICSLVTAFGGQKQKENGFLPLKIPHFVFPKVIKIFMFFVPFITVFVFTTITHFIPAPKATLLPINMDYVEIGKSIKSSFSLQENGFYRIDISFKNPNLRSKDILVMQITDQLGTPLLSQEFSGLNIGDPSDIRFDIPIQTNSRHQTYLLTVKALSRSENPLLIGVTDKITNQVVYVAFFNPKKTAQERLKESLTKFKTIINTLPFLYPALGTLAFLSV